MPMLPNTVIEQIYRSAEQPISELFGLTTELRYWHQAYPATNYLQPCLIGGKAALICQRQLSQISPEAYRALNAICAAHGIFLKEDARDDAANPSNFFHNRRKTAVILTFCLAMACNSQAANVMPQTSASAYTVTPPIAMSIHNQPLAKVAEQIAHQAGMAFKFDDAVEHDLINTHLTAATWKEALAQLLQNYNYSTIEEQARITTVLVSGYKGGYKPEVTPSETRLTSAGPAMTVADGIPIAISVDSLANLPEGGNLFVDLPVGSFNFKQESMVNTEDGTLSWVGTMDDEHQFYRLYLTKNADGEIIGNVFSPQGAYNIETIDGQLMLVEVNSVSMR